MSKFARVGSLLGMALLALILSAPAFAQGGGGAGGAGGAGGGRGGRGGGGGMAMDPAAQADMIKANVTATDAEWAIIQPLLVTAIEKSAAVGRYSAGRGGRGGRGAGGPAGGAAGTPAAGGAPPAARRGGAGPADEVTALQTTLANDQAPAADIKAKLDAVKAATAKANADLKTAREALRKVCNVRQEAQILLAGQLD
jgi:hypothetical protein